MSVDFEPWVGETHFRKDMCFPSRGHVTRIMCSWVGEHLSLKQEHVFLVICSRTQDTHIPSVTVVTFVSVVNVVTFLPFVTVIPVVSQ